MNKVEETSKQIEHTKTLAHEISVKINKLVQELDELVKQAQQAQEGEE